MPDVRIYQPIKNPMQSGKAKHIWLLEYIPQNKRSIDPLMGWTSSADTNQQLKLQFPSKEEAVAYATRKQLSYEVILPHQPKVIIQQYADNFK